MISSISRRDKCSPSPIIAISPALQTPSTSLISRSLPPDVRRLPSISQAPSEGRRRNRCAAAALQESASSCAPACPTRTLRDGQRRRHRPLVVDGLHRRRRALGPRQGRDRRPSWRLRPRRPARRAIRPRRPASISATAALLRQREVLKTYYQVRRPRRRRADAIINSLGNPAHQFRARADNVFGLRLHARQLLTAGAGDFGTVAIVLQSRTMRRRATNSPCCGCRPEAAAAAPWRRSKRAPPAGSPSSQRSASTCSGIRAERGDRRRSARDLAPRRGGETPLDVLCVEGSILRGPDGTGLFNASAAAGARCCDGWRALAPRARYCVAVGSCAAFGGVPAGAPDPTDACGLQYRRRVPGGALGEDYRSRSGLPVINIAGCAPHPGWIMETLVALRMGDIAADDLDAFGRPKFFAKTARPSRLRAQRILRVQGERREALRARLPDGASRLQGDAGGRRLQPARLERRRLLHPRRLSLHRLHLARLRGDAHFLETPKVGGIPVDLPLDMPKAWFVALAALSKSATPKRVSENAACRSHRRAPTPEGAEEA